MNYTRKDFMAVRDHSGCALNVIAFILFLILFIKYILS